MVKIVECKPEGVAQIRPPTSREFERVRRLAYEKFGLDLRDGNEPLVAARLGKKLGQLGLRTYREYLDQVQADASGDLLTGMIDALTTNHTMFLREPAHFVFLRQVVRAELRKRSPLEIWSAACSTGEEPYSIAICLLEELGAEAASRIRIVASDVSSRVLETAKHGVYAAERFEGFPAAWMSRYFLRGEKQRLGWYRVKAALRRLVDFRPINLMEPLGNMPRFPIIFCRNVMLYFDKATQRELVGRLAGCLEPGGYLVVGHSEGRVGEGWPLEYVQPAVYRKPLDGKAAGGRTKGGSCAR